jgi:uncharacterized membrane protein YqjE
MSNNEMKPIDWTITLFVASLPLIGLIMLFVWAFGDNPNTVRQNFAKGYLIFLAIGIVIAIFVMILFSSVISSIFQYAY